MRTIITRHSLSIGFLTVTAAIGFIAVASTGASSGGGVPPLNAADFIEHRENPYFPLQPGFRANYRSESPEGVETGLFIVTSAKKLILGVMTTVIHDRVFLNGDLVEETFDWYAADRHGNVWYFGEDSKVIEHGQVVSTEGSWQAGVNGAKPGIIMKANPTMGDVYYQEKALGIAEDGAKVVGVRRTVPATQTTPWFRIFNVPGGAFTNCVKTRDTSPLIPNVVEWKYYAPGVGLVLEVERHEDNSVTRNWLTSAYIP